MSASHISPLAPKNIVDLPPIAGFDMGAIASGERYANRLDLWVLRGQSGTQAAGVFTKNSVPGVPIIWSKNALRLSAQGPCLLVVNAGRANVYTGEAGRKVARQTAEKAAQLFGGQAERVLLASTGIIGQCPDITPIKTGLTAISQIMQPHGWEEGAEAIRTTDTFAKRASVTTQIYGQEIRINGIAKGSGMIMPDMATMLSFIATDAAISQGALQDILKDITDISFNAITVDSDSSTSDSVILMASGAAGHKPIEDAHDAALDGFKAALTELMQDLAQQIVRDGEGATKFFEINIEEAKDNAQARVFARSVANSPLVKTAVAGEDANWGRFMMAIGKTGLPLDEANISLYFGPHLVARHGAVDGSYNEDIGAAYMKNQDLQVTIKLGQGKGKAKMWSCDLTHGYISINADYRS